VVCWVVVFWVVVEFWVVVVFLGEAPVVWFALHACSIFITACRQRWEQGYFFGVGTAVTPMATDNAADSAVWLATGFLSSNGTLAQQPLPQWTSIEAGIFIAVPYIACAWFATRGKTSARTKIFARASDWRGWRWCDLQLFASFDQLMFQIDVGVQSPLWIGKVLNFEPVATQTSKNVGVVKIEPISTPNGRATGDGDD
jgi:hypothetical protein